MLLACSVRVLQTYHKTQTALASIVNKVSKSSRDAEPWKFQTAPAPAPEKKICSGSGSGEKNAPAPAPAPGEMSWRLRLRLRL